MPRINYHMCSRICHMPEYLAPVIIRIAREIAIYVYLFTVKYAVIYNRIAVYAFCIAF